MEFVCLFLFFWVLLSTLLHATAYMFLHNLLNIVVQIANKMGLQKNLQ
jgi:hypothetical protein